jgi:hypothetical protein
MKWVILLMLTFCVYLTCSDVRASIYLVDNSLGQKAISHVGRNGTNLTQIITDSAGDSPRDIVVDHGSGIMYWTSLNYEIIRSANVDGSNVQTVFSGLGLRTMSIELDPANGALYWTTGTTVPGGSTKIMRGNVDGTGLQEIVAGILGPAVDLELDLVGRKLYWTAPDEDRIRRSNLDGTSPQTLVSGIATVPEPWGIALDIANNRMYWGDDTLQSIRYSTMDGSNVQTLISSGIDDIVDLEFDPKNGALFWSDQDLDKIERVISGQREIILSGVAAQGFDLVVPEPSTIALAFFCTLSLSTIRWV